MAAKYAAAQLPLPDALPADAPSGLLMQDAMFRSEALRTNDRATADHYSAEAFGRLRDGMTEEVRQQTCLPRRTTFADQNRMGTLSRAHRPGRWLDGHTAL